MAVSKMAKGKKYDDDLKKEYEDIINEVNNVMKLDNGSFHIIIDSSGSKSIVNIHKIGLF